jgi:RNAse (barnase) inhibitor barstar
MKRELFVFVDDPAPLHGEGTLVVDVDPSLGSKADLLAWFADRLGFPDYFGQNWDAFNDCIRDLSWVPQRKLVLFHRALPLADQPADRKIYLEILADAVEDWRADRQLDFVVAMKSDLKP